MDIAAKLQSSDLIFQSDNLEVLRLIPSDSVQLVYIDPPFNTGRRQSRQTLRTKRSSSGDRVGFKGQSYETVRGRLLGYDDEFADYWTFLEPRISEIQRILSHTGSLYLHLDYREVHYAKVLLDLIFGRENFVNEIIWAYDYGARSKSKWPTKHDNILVYSKSVDHFYFDSQGVDREPYMAPGLVTKEKAELGKLPTDVWWHTIVSPTGKEKTGYPTQKPEGILRRIVTASSRVGDLVVDVFAGSGTTGAVAQQLERRFLLADNNPEAIETMQSRLSKSKLHQREVKLISLSD